MDVCIIGGGQAGLQCAESLRELGFDGEIRIFSEEPHLPYQRPPLTKSYLLGETHSDSLTLRNFSFFETNDIQLHTNTLVTVVNFKMERIEVLTQEGDSFLCDKLVFATGASARPVTVKEEDSSGFHTVRTKSDVDKLRDKWDSANNIVIVGGGFIGLESAAVAIKSGKRVSLIHSGTRLLSRAVTPLMSEEIYNAHTKRGTKFFLESHITGVIRDGETLKSLLLSGGEEITADLVIVGIGAVPRTELAEQIGVNLIDGAIRVDEHGQTSISNIYATGDVTALPTKDGLSHVRYESVQNAIDHAKHVAQAILGTREPYVQVPWFWSDQFDLKIQMAGWPHSHDQVVVRGDIHNEKFSLIFYRESHLVGIESMNDPLSFMAIRKALSQGLNIDSKLVSDTSIKLKDLVSELKE